MSLLAGVGFLLMRYQGWDWALPVFLIGGLLVAPLLPFKPRGDRETPPTP
ncbi:MAG: hypothetical protein AAGD14_01125 [Planctomycetota bacterium]